MQRHYAKKTMKKALSLALAFVMLLGLLSACSVTTGGDEKKEPQKTETQQTQQSQGDTQQSTTPAAPSRTDLNLVLSSQGATLDPHNSGQTVDLQVERQIYEGLVFADEYTNVSPRVAESWTIGADGKTYTFKLRSGVKFHNGDPVTVQDVVFSYNRAIGAAQMATYVSSIDHVEAKDDSTFVIYMKEPFSAFLLYASMVNIVSEKVVTEQGSNFGANAVDAGCGPYKLASYDISTEIKLEAFEDYYLGAPSIKNVSFKVVTDTNTSLIAFQTGDIDFLSVPAANWAEVKASGKYATKEHAANNIRYLALNPINPDSPLYDKRVRQAIQYAINKEEIIALAVEGLGAEAEHIQQVGSFYGAVETSWNYKYDLAKAKDLMKAAGYENGCDIGTIQCVSATYATAAQVIQEQLKAIGVKCEILQGKAATMLVDWRAGNYDAICNGHGPVFTYDFYRKYNNYTLSTCFMKYDRNPEIDEVYVLDMFEKAAAETDETKMNAMYKELEEYLMDASCWIPLWHGVTPFAWDKALNAETYSTYFYLYDWSWN